VTANVAPRLCADLHEAWQRGDFKTVARVNDRLAPLHDAMFCEASPGPVKYASSLLGKTTAETRLPLCEIAPESKERVAQAMRGAGLLN
jgi:4-hydroxy-tetrahydrodipicolinate synthase